MPSYSPSPAPEDPAPHSPSLARQSIRNSDDSSDAALAEQLQRVEQSLLSLKARYAQIQTDQERQRDLQHRHRQHQHQLRHTRSRTDRRILQQDLQHLQNELDALEVDLESQLFSWSGLREVFWQAVRFGGIGVVIGWVLKTLVG